MGSGSFLLLGASSYVGRHLLEVLGPERACGTYRSTPVPHGIQFDATRMRLKDVLPRQRTFDHALILLAETRLETCRTQWDRTYELNVTRTLRLIDDLLEAGIHPVYFSSDNVFDGEKGKYSEGDAPNPKTAYGRQKLEIERYLSRCGGPFTILRLSKVLGAKLDDGTLLSNWVKQISSGEEIRCASDQFFSPIHVDDVVRAVLETLERGLLGLYQVCNTESCSRLSLLRMLLDALHWEANVTPCRIQDLGLPDPIPRDLSMLPTKLLQSTGLAFRTLKSCCEEMAGNARATGLADRAHRN